MDREMLVATQQAAWAAQSAAQAAWWGLLLSGIAAVGAVGALWYALFQGARAVRYERLRAGALCHDVATAFAVLATCYDFNQTEADNRDFIQKSGALRRARTVVEQAKSGGVPNAKALSMLGYAMMQVDFIDNDIGDGGDGRGQLEEVNEVTDFFNKLSHDFLGRDHAEPWTKQGSRAGKA